MDVKYNIEFGNTQRIHLYKNDRKKDLRFDMQETIDAEQTFFK